VFAELAYGAVSNRSILTAKDAQLATLGIVMALQNQLPAVRQHLKVCACLGWTRNELIEVLIQLTGYIGWPLVLPVTRIALEVFAEIADLDLRCKSRADEPAQGQALVHPTEHARSALTIPAYIADISPLVSRYLDDPATTQPRLQSVGQSKAVCLTDISCLACVSRDADEEVLAAHMTHALALGASESEIVDAVMKALPHAGVLAVQSGLHVMTRVIGKTEHSENAARPTGGRSGHA
jgi:4-carboxymuconolactone decarboxylase